MSREEHRLALWVDKEIYRTAPDDVRRYLRRELLVVQGGKAAT